MGVNQTTNGPRYSLHVSDEYSIYIQSKNISKKWIKTRTLDKNSSTHLRTKISFSEEKPSVMKWRKERKERNEPFYMLMLIVSIINDIYYKIILIL